MLVRPVGFRYIYWIQIYNYSTHSGGDQPMTNVTETLKKAIEFEKMALEHYKEALDGETHEQTRKFLEKIASEKNQQIDSLHWMMMAESGELEIGEVAGSEEAEAKPTGGKCPFSGQLKEMGFDMDKMSSDMSEKNPHS